MHTAGTFTSGCTREGKGEGEKVFCLMLLVYVAVVKANPTVVSGEGESVRERKGKEGYKGR